MGKVTYSRVANLEEAPKVEEAGGSVGEDISLTQDRVVRITSPSSSSWASASPWKVFAASFLAGLVLAWAVFGNREPTGPVLTLPPSKNQLTGVLVETAAPTVLETRSPTPEPSAVITTHPTEQPTLPPTSIPTSEPSPAKTATPTLTPTKAVAFPTKYSIDERIASEWNRFEEDRKGFLTGKQWGTTIKEGDFQAFCAEQLKNHPDLNKVYYPFPPKSESYPKEKFSLKALADHVREFRYALIAHYHYPNTESVDAISKLEEASLNRVAEALYRKLNQFTANKNKNNYKIIYGFHGTSVMSGHDNCYYNTLAPLLGRTLEHLLAPLHAEVELRNLGQNGADAPDQSVQLLCSQNVIGEDLDFLHLWYPMMPQTNEPYKEHFIRRWFTESKTLAQITMTDTLFQFDSWADAGFTTKLLWNTDHAKLDWRAPLGNIWGVSGDAYCRFRTREDAAGTVMQNWHYGPMGFQFMADGISLFYAMAMERAVNWAMQGVKSAALPSLPAIPTKPASLTVTSCSNKCPWRGCTNWGNRTYMPNDPCMGSLMPITCISSSGPQFSDSADFVKAWKAASVKGNDFPNTSTWDYFQIKKVSTIGSAAEKVKENYSSRPECSSHADKTFAYRTRPTGLATDWLEVSWPNAATQKLSRRRTMIVLVCHGQRYPFKSYGVTLPSGWVAESTLNGKPVGKPFAYGDEANPALWICMRAFGGDPIPVPQREGAKFAVRFRNTNETNTEKFEVVVGNLIFVGV